MTTDSNATPARTPDARDLHPAILDAVEAMREHAGQLNAMAGEYYGAFPPTAEEREELIEVFASKLREAAQP